MTLRNVIVMFVLAALAVLAWLYVDDTSKKAPTMPATIPDFVKSEVLKISANYDGKTAVYRRREDRSDAWELETGTSTVRADANAIDELLSQLSRQNVIADIARGDKRARLLPADVAGYGLAATKTSIELAVSGNRPPVLVRFGKKHAQGEGVYVDTGEGTDIWVVGTGAFDQLTNMAATGARSNRISDLRAYDVGAVEIVKGGVTVTQVERQPSGTWRFSQPFAGWADPMKIDEWVSKLVNVEASWDVPEAGSVSEFGLDPAYAEVRLTPRKGGKPAVALVGSEIPGGGVFVLEQGRTAVGRTSNRLKTAVDTAATDLRDRSFARLGIGATGLRVRIGAADYELRKEGSSWDIVLPRQSGPAEEGPVRDALEKLQSWKTVEFLDTAKAPEFGIEESSDFVEVTLSGGAKSTFRLGREATDGTHYAMRKADDGESGVERVEGEVRAQLAKGWTQFKRRQVRDYGTFIGDLVRIARDQGTTEDGKACHEFVVERNPDDADSTQRTWHLSAKAGAGVVGTLDLAALTHLIGTFTVIRADEWVFFDLTKTDEMGFRPPLADTLTLTLNFAPKSGEITGGSEQVLMIGKRRPDGGYLARFNGEDWAFVLPDEYVKQLQASVLVQKK